MFVNAILSNSTVQVNTQKESTDIELNFAFVIWLL